MAREERRNMVDPELLKRFDSLEEKLTTFFEKAIAKMEAHINEALQDKIEPIKTAVKTNSDMIKIHSNDIAEIKGDIKALQDDKTDRRYNIRVILTLAIAAIGWGVALYKHF